MGRPWITVAFDIATRVVLGFALRLEPPSATSVGLALAMACLPKDQWLRIITLTSPGLLLESLH
jgi:putative transposase